MKVRIEEGCITCGLCESTCPDVFRIGDEGVAEVIADPKPENEGLVQEAADGCPVGVIVTG